MKKHRTRKRDASLKGKSKYKQVKCPKCGNMLTTTGNRLRCPYCRGTKDRKHYTKPAIEALKGGFESTVTVAEEPKIEKA